MQEYNGMIHKRDSDREWLNALIDHLGNNNKINANAKLEDYSDFVCPKCNKFFTKTAAIDSLQGFCDQCNISVIPVKESKLAKTNHDNEICECVKCGNHCTKKHGLKNSCKCGSKMFVSHKMMNKICSNTKTYLTSKGINVDDIWHEKGNVFASLKGQNEDKSQWKTIVAANGVFTENDVIMFEWNKNSGYGLVATAQSNNLLPFSRNEKCTVEWTTEDDYVDPNNVSLQDVNNNAIKIGDNIVWYTNSGSNKAKIINATNDRKLIAGITQDEYGKYKCNQFPREIKISQQYINKLQIEKER